MITGCLLLFSNVFLAHFISLLSLKLSAAFAFLCNSVPAACPLMRTADHSVCFASYSAARRQKINLHICNLPFIDRLFLHFFVLLR